MDKVTRAKIAKVLGEHEAAINAGLGAGVRVGDIAKIQEEIEVLDPDSGESLGTVLVTKVRLEVKSVGDKLCVARVIDRVQSPIGSGASLKRLTEDPFEQHWASVLVRTGAPVGIERSVGLEDDVSF